MKRASNGAWYFEKKVDGKTGTVPRHLWPTDHPRLANSPSAIEAALRSQAAQEDPDAVLARNIPGYRTTPPARAEQFTREDIEREKQASWVDGYDQAAKKWPRPLTRFESIIFIAEAIIAGVVLSVIWGGIVGPNLHFWKVVLSRAF